MTFRSPFEKLGQGDPANI
jgi:hypothetical protein